MLTASCHCGGVRLEIASIQIRKFDGASTWKHLDEER